jgi:hypothetical protein
MYRNKIYKKHVFETSDVVIGEIICSEIHSLFLSCNEDIYMLEDCNHEQT